MGHSMAELFKGLSDDVKSLNPDLFGDFGITTHTQLVEDLKPGRRNKYGNHKIEVDGRTFDSKKEANRYLTLRNQERAGIICGLILQCEIILVEGFTFQGKKVQAIKYTADFVYGKDGKTVVEDVKSIATSKTTDFRIRWRLLQHLYKDRDDVILLLSED